MIHLIMGEGGFFWMRRLLHLNARAPDGAFERKYTRGDGDLAAAPARVLQLLEFFDGVLQRQEVKYVRLRCNFDALLSSAGAVISLSPFQ